jgi:anthranilate phosphoribosyltransferase
MKYAAPVRKELGIKTVFNILGPLTNPAGVKRQLVGAFNRKAARTMAQAAKYLDYDKAVFLCNNNKYDEVFLEDTTDIYEYVKPETISSYAVSNKTFGYQAIPTAHIKGSSPDVNAKILMDLFTKKLKDGIFYTTAANAALGLYSAGYSESLEDCKLAAEESILSGAALKKLNQLIDHSKSC